MVVTRIWKLMIFKRTVMELAAGQDDDAAGRADGFRAMRDDDTGRDQSGKGGVDGAFARYIQGAGRLVQQQPRGAVKGAGQQDELLLPARQDGAMSPISVP